MEMLWQDLRYAVRRLAAAPLTTLAIVGTLALGIGATSAVFSVVQGVLLAPLPYPDSDRLVDVYVVTEGSEATASPPDFADWKRMAGSFEHLAASWRSSAAMSGRGEAEQLRSARITDDFFQVLGIAPAMGRGFGPDEQRAEGPAAAIVSHAVWQRKLGSDPEVIGAGVTIEGEPTTIVGVMPRGFQFPQEVELWLPARFSERDLTTQRGAHYLNVIGKLKPGVSTDRATAEMQGIVAALEKEYPDTNRGWSGALVRPVLETMTGDVRPALLMLLGAVGLVLLLACANIANLLLARAIGRRREISLRTALGASRSRIVLQLLVESLLLALVAGAVGLLLASWVVAGIASLEIDGVPRLGEIGVDGTVLAFTIAVSVATALLFGTFPALLLGTRRNLESALREGEARSGAGRRGRSLRSLLVVSEVALSLLLVSGAGLLIKSFAGLASTDPGFDPDGVLTFQLSLPDSRYEDPARKRAFFAELLSRIEALPGTESAGAVFGLPMTGLSYTISVEKLDGAALPDGDDRYVQIRVTTPGYFDAMRVATLRGRGFTAADEAGAPDVAIVNATAAKLLWPDGDAVGRTIEVGTRLGRETRVGGRIVGVVADVRDRGLGAPPSPELYLPYAQVPVDFAAFAVRSQLDPRAAIPAIRSIVAEIDPELPIFRTESMRSWVSRSIAVPRVLAILLGTLAGIAMLLVAIGIFAVIAYGVGERRRELGIRMALGATGKQIVRLVTREAARLAALGVAIGLLASLAARGLLAKVLVEVSPVDPAVWVGAVVILAAIALIAAAIPARRAGRVDPVRALRHE
ncbi:MAG TPA: ABC transporter permease [Thermoanaerobaculia bacterium]|nr:ABC transporter permease [Thermoanaerobaculia bacterium]